jgi:uncharacterized protein YjdB
LEGTGDTSYYFLGQFIGTKGQNRRLEAFRIEVVGEFAERFDVYYQAHIENTGDTGWKRNGEYCGTPGLELRVEAIAVYIAEKDKA